MTFGMAGHSCHEGNTGSEDNRFSCWGRLTVLLCWVTSPPCTQHQESIGFFSKCSVSPETTHPASSLKGITILASPSPESFWLNLSRKKTISLLLGLERNTMDISLLLMKTSNQSSSLTALSLWSRVLCYGRFWCQICFLASFSSSFLFLLNVLPLLYFPDFKILFQLSPLFYFVVFVFFFFTFHCHFYGDFISQ